MNEKFSKIGHEKRRDRRMNGAIFGCFCVLVFPVIGTAFIKTEAAVNHSTLLSNAGFIFSLFLFPLVFFGIYKLDRMVEKKIPKREQDSVIADDENAFSPES